jgi:hypothetical protein
MPSQRLFDTLSISQPPPRKGVGLVGLSHHREERTALQGLGKSESFPLNGSSTMLPRVAGTFVFIAALSSVVALLPAPRASASAIRTLPNLQTITIYEQTGSTFAHVYGPNDSVLLTRLGDPLSPTNNDFSTTSAEYYDVFYSDANGTFDMNGAYLTVQARFDASPSLPPGAGGLNINEIQLNYTGGVNEFGNTVTNFVMEGFGTISGSQALAADGNLATWSTMGSTDPANPTDRLSITIGFASTVPEPSTLMLVAPAIGALLLCRGVRDQERRSSLSAGCGRQQI